MMRTMSSHNSEVIEARVQRCPSAKTKRLVRVQGLPLPNNTVPSEARQNHALQRDVSAPVEF